MKGLLSLAYALLGVLVISAVLLSLGEREVAASPSAISRAPSGTAAFAELLRRRGYRVALDRRETPKLTKDDLAVAFVLRKESFFEPEADLKDRYPFSERIRENLTRFVQDGGTLFVLPVDDNFQQASREVQRSGSTLVAQRGSSLKVSLPEEGNHDLSDAFVDRAGGGMNIWSDRVRLRPSGAGLVVSLADGLPATNRFLDQDDNAQWLLTLIEGASPGKGNVVFTEAAAGIVRTPGLMESIGAWASVAWWQLLFAFLVVAFSLGRRFGIPELAPYHQRGARELVDAMATTYRRGRKAPAALTVAVEEAEYRLRRWKRIPRDASDAEIERLLPEDIVTALRQSRIAAQDPKLSTAQAVELARRLNQKVDDLLAV